MQPALRLLPHPGTEFTEIDAAGMMREIGISLDGVEGSDLPYSHCGPRVLDTIRFPHDRPRTSS